MWKAMLKDGSWIGFVAPIATGLFLIIVSISRFPEDSWSGLLRVCVGCFLFVTAYLTLLWKKKRTEKRTVVSKRFENGTAIERAQWIGTRADNAGALALLLVWALACFTPWVIATATDQQAISIRRHWFPFVLSIGILIMVVVRMIAIWYIRKRERTDGPR